MNFSEYQRQAIVTKKKWDTKAEEIAYCGLGLAGESGEVVDILKKHFSGSKPLFTERDNAIAGDIDDEKMEKLKQEIGDTMWYIAATCDAFGFDMGEIANLNIEKLRKRHGDSWSGYGKR